MHKAKIIKLFYLVFALTLLAGLIPFAALPGGVSAAPSISMVLVDPITGVASADPDSGYNTETNTVQITVTPDGKTIEGWSISNLIGDASFVGDPDTEATVKVIGVQGEAVITCTFTDGTTISVDKKWGKILSTDISDPQSVPVVWYEATKTWEASATVIDEVTGDFVNEFGVHFPHVMQGTILNWYLIDGAVPVSLAPGEAPDLKSVIGALPRAKFVQFGVKGNVTGTYIQTVSGSAGISTVSLFATGEEAVQVVVVPEYPTTVPQLPVTPELTTVNFWTREMEKVPQVRWAGEKIVLEKNFTTAFTPANSVVCFKLENQSPGTLVAIAPVPTPLGGVPGQSFVNDSQQVWTVVDSNGLASVLLLSEDPGEVDVDCELYVLIGEPGYYTGMALENEHGFVVYYMKLEEITLGNVQGKRAGHNTGLWEPANPWDVSLDHGSAVVDVLNVSQDALLRANVKGWFCNANPSVREVRPVDITGDGVADIILPAGRWVLPDDWATLAGYNWQERRLHWDIMDQPFDLVVAPAPLGSYNTVNGAGQTVQTTGNVIGPFSPGIELMTPLGWNVQLPVVDSMRAIRTVVPNGVLDKWDAPMPPAKIIFEINFGVGFFKSADKAQIYYAVGTSGMVYTNPFYQELIPAHQAIPAFINNGGYDWATWGTAAGTADDYGPYPFWQIINRPDLNAKVDSSDPAGHPTKVEVYSDNHGEAMVWLNGDWNLDLTDWIGDVGYDVAPGATVGVTDIQAMADYPYLRKHQPVLSNVITKEWTWGKQILGTSPATYPDGSVDAADVRMVLQTGTYTIVGGVYPNEIGMSDKKMAWVWLNNRDGLVAGEVGVKVEWFIQTPSATGIIIPPVTGTGISNYNEITQNIALQDGFLAGTGGVCYTGRTSGYSFTRLPTETEMALFAKFWPALDPTNYAVAAVEIWSSVPTAVDLAIMIHETREGDIIRHTNLDFAAADRLDDPLILGDANMDGVVNMGDVVTVERTILGLCQKTVDADANANGSVDMGDVVKIERTLLGL